MSPPSLNSYEATVILDTRGYEKPVDTLGDALKETIKELGGELSDLQDLGKKDFTRVTERDHTADTYLQLTFSGPPTLPEALQDAFRLNNNIKRIMVLTRK